MDDKMLIVLRGQGMIMEMLLDMMPGGLSDAWLDDVNEFNQAVVDAFGKPVLGSPKWEKDKEK